MTTELRISESDYHLMVTGPATDYRIKRAEELAWKFWESDATIEEYCTLCESSEPLVLEADISGAIKRQLVNVVQLALGAGAEIGITAAGVGSTAPVGVAAEVAVDTSFAAVQAGTAVKALADIKSAAGEVAEIASELASVTLSDNLDAIYDAVLRIIEKAKSLAEKAGVKLEEYLDKANEAIGDVLKGGATAIGDVVGAMIPSDFGITGAAIAEIFIQLAENAFTIVKKMFDALPDVVRKMIVDPNELEAFMNSVIDITVEFLEKMGEENPDPGFFDKIKGIADKATDIMIPAKGAFKMANKYMKIREKMISFLDGKVRSGIKPLVKLLQKLLPFMFAGVAFYQIVANGEYKDGSSEEAGEKSKEEKPAEKEKLAASYNIRDESILRDFVRQIIAH